jgi:hypothetical protein
VAWAVSQDERLRISKSHQPAFSNPIASENSQPGFFKTSLSHPIPHFFKKRLNRGFRDLRSFPISSVNLFWEDEKGGGLLVRRQTG